jgi:hypothetical protein
MIPDQMRTDEDYLERLVSWYRGSDYFSARGNQNPCVYLSFLVNNNRLPNFRRVDRY